jgi:hypothetical protein
VKWFFCWCQDSDFRDDHGWQDLIRVAVHSARLHTDLKPHFIYDGEPSAFTAELAAQGVNVIFHRLSFTDALSAHQPDNREFQAVARGAFLRFDIPLFFDAEDRFVLYTDVDVMFRHQPDFRGYYPGLIAAAPQCERGLRVDMNSGVMLVNAVNFRDFHPQLVDFTRRHLDLGLDQEVMRAILGNDYLLLPDLYNWKPYWGVNPEAPIIHWHGPKPVTMAKLLSGETTRTHDAWQVLFERDQDSYRAHLAAFHAILKDYRTGAAGHLAGTGRPLSRYKHATASSAAAGLRPSAALDGSIDGRIKFMTAHEASPWWQVDLGRFASIASIHVHMASTPEGTWCRRLSLSASIDGTSWVELCERTDESASGPIPPGVSIWAGPGQAWARYVRVTGLDDAPLAFDQVEVFGKFD